MTAPPSPCLERAPEAVLFLDPSPPHAATPLRSPILEKDRSMRDLGGVTALVEQVGAEIAADSESAIARGRERTAHSAGAAVLAARCPARVH